MSLPDWSEVSSGRAREALHGLMETADWSERWSGLSAAEDGVRRAVLELFGTLGRAPSLPELGAWAGLEAAEVTAQLEQLAGRDMVVLDGAGGALVGAYPLSDRDTGHRVQVAGRALNAMCAVDALGIGAMYGHAARVESSCRDCGAPIRVELGAGGATLDAATPADPVVWFGLHYDGGCAATSLCTLIAFFCGDDHLGRWREQNPASAGYRLSLAEAFEIGKALFAGRLEPAASP
jgi:hypothetical protein